MSLVAGLKACLERYQLNQQPLVIAYSGGLDSHVLLHAAAQLRQHKPQRQLRALYVNHGLSPHADMWQAHCQRVCGHLDVLFDAIAIHLSPQRRQSLEAEAREARYTAIASYLSVPSVVLLAQHQDDQLETFLLQAKRGAGPKGLAAMPECRQQQGHHWLRPLLNFSRTELTAYAEHHQLHWIEDESNQDQQFDRNFLRHKIVPELKQRWPQIAKTISRSAALCAEQQGLLDEVVKSKITALMLGKQLSIEGLLAHSFAWQKMLIRHWLQRQNVPLPSEQQLLQIVQMLQAADDANPQVSWQQWQCRRFNRQLFVLPTTSSNTYSDIEWHGQSDIILPAELGRVRISQQAQVGGLAVQVDPNEPVKLCFSGFSRRFTPPGSRHSKPLKQWFKEWQIPPWERSKQIQVVNGDTLLALYTQHNWLLNQAEANSLTTRQTWYFCLLAA